MALFTKINIIVPEAPEVQITSSYLQDSTNTNVIIAKINCTVKRMVRLAIVFCMGYYII